MAAIDVFVWLMIAMAAIICVVLVLLAVRPDPTTRKEDEDAWTEGEKRRPEADQWDEE